MHRSIQAIRILSSGCFMLLALSGLAPTAVAGWTSSQGKALSDWEHHCLWRITCLSESYNLTADQAAAIQYCLQERRYSMELFGRFGLLDEQAQRRKMQEIYDVTAGNIETLLQPRQRELWLQWEKAFNSRRAISRTKDSPFQGRGSAEFFALQNAN